MAFFYHFMRMMLSQQAGPQRLGRTPEPSQLTDAELNVIQYDRVMSTKLAIAYAGSLEVVHRARNATEGGAAIDLACGPGHYSLCLARYLNYDEVVGIDLAEPMVDIANKNAALQGLDQRVHFRLGDVTKLRESDTGYFDLASFTGAAHHMPDVETVQRVLYEMDRITKPDGLVMVMDLARLRTAALTERYVQTLGADYVERGLPQFYDDFRNSMYAAWTVQELRQSIPQNTRRSWCHLVPRGLPSVQVVLGLPVGRQEVFVRSGLPWGPERHPVSEVMHPEWKMMRLSLFSFGARRVFPPLRVSA